jgi:flagellin
MKNIFFLFCVLFCFSEFNAQVITVVDGTTLLPISNVTIVNIENNNEIGKTNQNGILTINTIPSLIGFSHPDYSNYTISKKDLTNKGFKIYLNQNYNSINEIVISASKFEEKRKDVAQKIQVISNSELQFQNQSSTADVLSNTAITKIDLAFKELNTARAEIGATINRLTYAADNLSNVSTNTAGSRSRIQDTDYAVAAAELARTQIIQQAGTAMLAQANQAPQSVLALLK